MASLSQERQQNAAPRVIAVCAFLLLAIALVFGRTISHDFVNYDDYAYVSENPQVAGGLSARGIQWAFTQRYAGNWHPLAWLSHMLDTQIYALKAGGHHLSSVLLHAASAILLFLILRQMTGRFWPSAFVAALFAIHPLRVESVAWVAERKDVLSGLFFMFALGGYAWYARSPHSLIRYLGLVTIYALGLMSKPMLVTLPLVLLLLDYWPLGRMKKGSVPALVREKIPLAMLAAAACAVTLWAQEEALAPSEHLPFAWRLGNAIVAYVAYVGKFFYPAQLAVFYPHPQYALPLWKIAASALVLLGMTVGTLAGRRRHPHLLVGWLWYVGMLVPVIGVVQVGAQGMADRYTYLPQIGLGVTVAWGVAAASPSWAHRRWVPIAAGASFMLLALIAWLQTGYWRNSETLNTHALESTSRNHVAHSNLGVALAARGQIGEAIGHYRTALEIKPNDADTHYNLGNVLAARGQIGEAISHYRLALEIKPNDADTHYNLGNVLVARGQFDEAISHYRKALEINPEAADAHYNLGNVLVARGQIGEAVANYREALDLAVRQGSQTLAEALRQKLAVYESR